MSAPLLIVAGSERGRELFARARELGFAVEGCGARELNRRIRRGESPAAILLSSVDADPALALAGLRRTRAGAAIPVVVFGPADGEHGDLDAVLDAGGDGFVPTPVEAAALAVALEEVGVAPGRGPSKATRGPSSQGSSGEEWPGGAGRTRDRDAILRPFAPRPRGDLPAAGYLERPVDHPTAAERTEIIDTEETGPIDDAAPMGDLHATLDRLEARLRRHDEGGAADGAGDQLGELDDFGFDEIPDVEPDGEPIDPGDSGTSLLPPETATPAPVSTFTDVELLRDVTPAPRDRSDSGRYASSDRSGSAGRHEGAERSGVLRPRRPPRSHPPDSEAPELTRGRRAGAVERERRVLPESDRSGDFEREALPQLLWQLHQRRASGRLAVRRNGVDRDLWLIDGELRFVRSQRASERLVDSLLRRGVLTRAQYETARRLAAKEPRRAGQLLVDAGFIKPRELGRVVRDHLERLVEACFGTSSGQWSWYPGEQLDEEVVLERPLERLIFDGVRGALDRGALLYRLGARVLRPHWCDAPGRAQLGAWAERLGLLPEEADWLAYLDGRNGVRELLEVHDDEVGLLALIYTLHVVEAVEMLGDEAARQPAKDPAQIDAERIEARLRMAREDDYFVLLGVGRDASRAAVRRAYRELVATFADENLEDETRELHGEALGELRSALAEANDILVDEGMRSAYLAHLDVDPSGVMEGESAAPSRRRPAPSTGTSHD